MNQSGEPRPALHTRWSRYKESRAYWLLGLWVYSFGVLMNATALLVKFVSKSLRTSIIWFGAAGVLVAVAAVTFVVVMLIRAHRS